MKTNVQGDFIVLESVSPCLAATASIAGSAMSVGFAKITGLFRSDVDTETGSGLRIEQSSDFGTTWDIVSGSDLIPASTATACIIDVVGNAVRVTVISGGSAASSLRTSWRLRPI